MLEKNESSTNVDIFIELLLLLMIFRNAKTSNCSYDIFYFTFLRLVFVVFDLKLRKFGVNTPNIVSWDTLEIVIFRRRAFGDTYAAILNDR